MGDFILVATWTSDIDIATAGTEGADGIAPEGITDASAMRIRGKDSDVLICPWFGEGTSLNLSLFVVWTVSVKKLQV